MKQKTKRCSACGKDKRMASFAKHQSNADGKDGRCKTCVRRAYNEKKPTSEYKKEFFVHDKYFL